MSFKAFITGRYIFATAALIDHIQEVTRMEKQIGVFVDMTDLQNCEKEIVDRVFLAAQRQGESLAAAKHMLKIVAQMLSKRSLRYDDIRVFVEHFPEPLWSKDSGRRWIDATKIGRVDAVVMVKDLLELHGEEAVTPFTV